MNIVACIALYYQRNLIKISRTACKKYFYKEVVKLLAVHRIQFEFLTSVITNENNFKNSILFKIELNDLLDNINLVLIDNYNRVYE